MKLEPKIIREWQDHKHDSQVEESVFILQLPIALSVFMVVHDYGPCTATEYFDDYGAALDLANELMEEWSVIWFINGDQKEKMR
jgi:hypothetical protein